MTARLGCCSREDEIFVRCSYPIFDHSVYRFSMVAMDSSMYLVPVERSCLVVDPCISEGARTLLEELGIRDCLVLLTHEHYDHISGVNWLRRCLPCQVVCSKSCAERIEDPKKNLSAYFKVIASQSKGAVREALERFMDLGYTCRADQTYTGQTELLWEGLTLTLQEAPGHSLGSQLFRIGERWYFTGDSLIPGLPLVFNLPGGDRACYEEKTRPLLEAIAPGSILFPGHGPETVFNKFFTLRENISESAGDVKMDQPGMHS